MDVYRFFVAQVVLEIYGKKHKVQNQLDVFLCYSLNMSTLTGDLYDDIDDCLDLAFEAIDFLLV